MRILITSLLVGFAFIIYGISVLLKIKNGKPIEKGASKKSATLMLISGIIIFVGGTYLSTYLRDKNKSETSQTRHELYKDLTFDEWKTIVNDAMAEYRHCTNNMDKGNYDLQTMCIQSAQYKGTDFKHDLDTKANLSYEQIQQLKDFWDQQWEETRKSVNEQIEANDRRNYPNKYQ